MFTVPGQQRNEYTLHRSDENRVDKIDHALQKEEPVREFCYPELVRDQPVQHEIQGSASQIDGREVDTLLHHGSVIPAKN